MNDESFRPIEFRKGRAKVLAWPRKSINGVFYNFSVKSLYPDRKSGKLKEGESFDLRDMVNLAHAVLAAEEWYRKELKQAYAAKKEAEAQDATEACGSPEPNADGHSCDSDTERLAA